MTTQSNGNNLVVQGRIVWITGESLFEGKQKTDFNTNAPVFGNDGNPVVEYGFGIAIPKIDPATGQNSAEYVKVYQALHAEALTLYPGGQLPPGFAMKYKDGDSVDHNGKSFSEREGYAGHIVLSCTTQIPIKFFKFEGGNNILVNDGIKNGDYVNVQLNIKAHPAKGQGKPGLYLNPSAVQLIQAGQEIIKTPSGDAIFGQAAPAYSGQVVADTAPTMPNVAHAPAAPAMPGQAPAAPVAPVAPAPHYDVLPAGHQPQAPVAPAAPVMPGQAPAAPVMPGQAPAAPVMPVMPGQAPVAHAPAAPVMPVMPQ